MSVAATTALRQWRCCVGSEGSGGAALRSPNCSNISFPAKLRRAALSLTCCSVSDDTSATTSDHSLAVKNKASDISPQLKGTSIFLVGMNKGVKTRLGKLLAETLRYYYMDSDDLVEQAVGGAEQQGCFREAENEVLKQLSSMGRLVVCAGNGAVQTLANLALLRHGISIWIDVPLAMVVPENSTSDIADLREGYATADATISLQKVASQLGYDHPTAVTTHDLTLEVLKEIEKLTRVKKMMEAAATPF